MIRATPSKAGVRAGRGFTLIEVLIATFILALGSLGLIVLFAGAASQQQRSAQLDQSVFVSKNAEAIMGRRFGAIEGAALADTTTYPPGAWLRLEAKHAPGDPSIGTLAIDTRDRGHVYFVIEEPNDVILYKREASNFTSDYGWESGLPDGPFAGRVRTTGYARTLASTMTVRIIWGEENPSNPGEFVEDPLSPVVWDLVAEPEPLAGEIERWPSAAGQVDPRDGNTVFTSGGGTSFPQSYIAFGGSVDRDPTYMGWVDEGATSILALRVEAVLADPTLVVDEIRLEGGFRYLASEIISLEDRVIHVQDDDYPAPLPGRPVAAYALLYRTGTGGAASQLAAFTYTITGGRARAEYLPDERPDVGIVTNPEAPVQPVDLKLHWDDALEQYYVRAVNDDDAWAIEPGQILLAAGDALGPGADFAVRVLSQRTIDDEVRGYLDRVPRAGGQSLLETFAGSTDITVWAIQPTVKNIEGSGIDGSGDEVFWRLKPQEVRVFQL